MWDFLKPKREESYMYYQSDMQNTLGSTTKCCPMCGVAFFPRSGWYYVNNDDIHIPIHAPNGIDPKCYRVEDSLYCSRCAPEFKKKADIVKWAKEHLDVVDQCKEAYENGGKEL